MAKLPGFMFYPGDWLKEPSLRRCTHAAKGIYIDILCLMFECSERGVLATDGIAWTDDEIAQAVGGDKTQTLEGLRELVEKRVVSRTDKGAVYSRRMVRDEKKRQLCGDAGKRGGGNPQFAKGNPKGANKGPPKGEREYVNEGEFGIESSRRFKPPTVLEVLEYCAERKNNVDAQYFVDHYTANGWVQGRQGKPLKDWKAAVRTWEKNDLRPISHAGGKDYSIAQLPEEP